MKEIKRIHHIAVVVEDLDAALLFWKDKLGLSLEKVETVTSQEVKIAFLPVGESEIELLEPLTGDSGVAKFLRKRGPGMHHLCLEVENISQKLLELEQQGVSLIHEDPLVMDDGRKMAFLHPRSAHGVLIELYQLP